MPPGSVDGKDSKIRRGSLISRRHFMKRAAFVAMIVVVIASGWTFLAAQSSPVVPQKTFPDGIAVPAGPSAAALPVAVAGPAVDRPSPLTPLQQRFVDLASKKARLMSEDQLQQAVNKLDQDVEELNAWSKVEESAKALREVVEKHPQSRAARAARAALQMIEENRSPFSLHPGKQYQREKFERQPFDPPQTEPSPSQPPKV
jgi:hypothetical protein